MSKRVYTLKRATPRMKYHYMHLMMDFKADLKEHQANFTGDPKVTCQHCGGEVEKAPMKTNTCYDCYRNIYCK